MPTASPLTSSSATSTAPPTSPTRWRAGRTRRTRTSSRAAASRPRRSGTGTMPSAIARQRKGLEHELEIREHRLTVDEPQEKGGTDSGPTPTELLAGSLAACTSITLLMYAGRKEWDLGGVEVAVEFTEGSGGVPASFEVT